MSINLMTAAWRIRDMAPTQKLVLLALCDWANDYGESLHPSIKAVAERAALSERQAKRLVHELIDAGFVEVIGNRDGGAPGATRQYRINVRKLVETSDAHVTGSERGSNSATGDTGVTGDRSRRVTPATETGDMGVQGRVTPATETGDTHVTQTVIEPSKEPSKNRHGARDSKPAPPRPSRRCPDTFEVDGDLRSWAASEVPGLDVDRETRAFRDHEFAKPRSDWRATWRNWMRNADSRRPSTRVSPRRETTEEHNRRALAEWLGQGDGRTIDG